MIVMKFGGTSLGNAKRIRNVAKIVSSQKLKAPIVVVSALSGVTDDLIGIANSIVSGIPTTAQLAELIQRHYDTLGELNLRPEIIAEEVEQLKKTVGELYLSDDVTPKIRDKLMSFGERLSARIVAAHISDVGFDSKAYDSFDLGLVTDSNFGEADVLPESYSNLKKRVPRSGAIPIVTGFIGKDKEGNITTLGRGGSDYTASIIGSAVGAEEIQIWKDVNGIMTADPKVVSRAKNIDMLSYDEASELAILGAKVLHPKAILPAINSDIPVRILNTFKPKLKGTVVLKDIKLGSRIASIAYKRHIKVINISTTSMPLTHGFISKVFEIFEKRRIPIDMIATTDSNISVTIDGRYKTNPLIEDLRDVANVDVRNDRATISLVGNGLVYIPGVLEKLFSSLKGIDIEMIPSSESKINQSVVVKGEHADKAVKLVHTTFFGR